MDWSRSGIPVEAENFNERSHSYLSLLKRSKTRKGLPSLEEKAPFKKKKERPKKKIYFVKEGGEKSLYGGGGGWGDREKRKYPPKRKWSTLHP